MAKKIGKNHKRDLAKENIEFYFDLLEKRFLPEYDPKYIKEILRFSKGFNIRLTRDQKLKFCKNCHIFWDINTREIRLNPQTKTKDYTCKNCGFTRRFRYK